MHCIHDVQECGTTHIKFCTKVEEMRADIYEMVKTSFQKEAVSVRAVSGCATLMMEVTSSPTRAAGQSIM
jgi:hypothetical protein